MKSFRKLSVAVLLSGHMRTFERCLPTLHWHVLRLFGRCDFYVSTVLDGDAPKADLLRGRYPGAQVEIDAVPSQPELPLPQRPAAPDWTLGRMYTHEPYSISVHPQAIVRQLWQLEKAWHLYAARRRAEHDLVLRCRPDLWWHSFAPPERLRPARAYTPWWGRFGGVNDRFALLPPRVAPAYFGTFHRMESLVALGAPLHVESLIRASLTQAGHAVDDTLRAEFSTLRPNGELRAPEISHIDLAHAGRGGLRP